MSTPSGIGPLARRALAVTLVGAAVAAGVAAWFLVVLPLLYPGEGKEKEKAARAPEGDTVP